MAPTIIQTSPIAGDIPNVKSTLKRKPLKYSGSLDQFKHFESTPVIGREYTDAQLAEWIASPNADTLLRDLAITSTHLISINQLT
jgi:hypothetical protein